MARQLPRLVSQLTTRYDAWLVGSAAAADVTSFAAIRDFDVIVPFARWAEAACLIPRESRVNTFGGWKCESEGKYVDVWPADLAMLMQQRPLQHLWHPKSGTRFSRV